MVQIKVKNTKDRYFNWVWLNWVLTVEENRKDYYLRNWFVLVQEKKQEEKQTEKINWVVDRKKVIEQLEHLWIEFRKNAKTADLVKLLQEANNEAEEAEDLEKIKKQLVDEAIVKTIDWLSDEEIKKIAKDNWLI